MNKQEELIKAVEELTRASIKRENNLVLLIDALKSLHDTVQRVLLPRNGKNIDDCSPGSW